MTLSEQSAVKHLMNTPENLVLESLHGLCYANPHLKLLEKDKVIYYSDIDTMAQNQVTLISGGGSGHEPGYAGFVGENGLAASVCGHIFASPSSSQVLAAIRRAQSPHGTLVIVMNYTGDCLNFGLAVERAKALGIRVELVVVGDDVAVGREKGEKVGRRGMAATALAVKLAGALAAKKASLEKIREMVQYTIDHSATLGVAFNHCHVPGSDNTHSSMNALGPEEMELGMGIHNEAGFLKTKLMPAHELVAQMLDMLVDQHDTDRSFLPLVQASGKPIPIVLLVNNLGGTAMIELNVVVKEAVEYIMKKNHMLTLERVYVGSFVTSLNMAGFSFTLLSVVENAQQLLELLDMPMKVMAWNSLAVATSCFNSDIYGKEVVAVEEESRIVNSSAVMSQVTDPQAVRNAISGATSKVIQAEPCITQFDTVLGDGDCGQTLKTAALAIQNALPGYELSNAAKTILSMADTIEQSVGGTSSALYCIFLNALGYGLLKHTAAIVDASVWVLAARHALTTLMTYTHARVGDRTLMDTLCPFIETLNDDASNLQSAVQAGIEGAEGTRHLTAKLGRSSYLSNEKVLESDVPDAGAYGLAAILEGLFGVNG